ncbi:endolytic transglycosylase MltG, partial [Acinetobacter baumannii]
PDTYLFAKGASDMQVYKQAFALMSKKLNEAWARRDLSLPYRTPYEALTMASIVEKETGQKSERGMVAGVFVNRLRTGMLLQTDPTVIYGMGD